MKELLKNFIFEFWAMTQESAPWLLLGFGIAGVIHIYLPISIIKKNLANKGSLSILKGTLLGIPLPLCSCSVIPVTQGIRLSGASKGATAAFMVSTPEIGIDSFLLTKGLLGLPLALIRVLAAFVSAFISGLLIERVSDPDFSKDMQTAQECCKKEGDLSDNPHAKKKSWLNFSFYELPADLSKPLLIGFCLSALIASLLPKDFISTNLSNPHLQIFLALFISMPLYVCASSSTPIAASLIAKGLSPGAALVFLLAGPATNTSTVLAANKMFGLKGAIAYVISITGISLFAGYLVEIFGLGTLYLTTAELSHEHSHGSLINNIAGVILLSLLLFPIFKSFKNRN